MENKPGWKTSEFWLSVAAVLVGALLASGAITSVPMMQALGIAASVLGALGYTAARGFVKVGDAKASAIISAATMPQPVTGPVAPLPKP